MYVLTKPILTQCNDLRQRIACGAPPFRSRKQHFLYVDWFVSSRITTWRHQCVTGTRSTGRSIENSTHAEGTWQEGPVNKLKKGGLVWGSCHNDVWRVKSSKPSSLKYLMTLMLFGSSSICTFNFDIVSITFGSALVLLTLAFVSTYWIFKIADWGKGREGKGGREREGGKGREGYLKYGPSLFNTFHSKPTSGLVTGG